MGARRKPKAWQIVLLCLFAFLFIASTAIICVFYKNAIFTENTLAIALMCASGLALGVMCAIGWRYFKK